MKSLGTMSENTVGYTNAVNEVEKILINSGRTDKVSDVVRSAIAAMIWSSIAPGNLFSQTKIYEHDLDTAVEEIERQLKKIF
jgi:predicted oxidoreductase